MLTLADGHSDELILFQSQTEYTKYQTGLTKENRLGRYHYECRINSQFEY